MEACWPASLGSYHGQAPTQKHFSQQTRGRTDGEQEVTIIFLFLYDLHQFQGRSCTLAAHWEHRQCVAVWLEQLLRKNCVTGVGDDRAPSPEPLNVLSPVLTEGLSGSWKEGAPSSSSSSGYWSWSAPSDQSNPSTPSPPLSADSFKPFRSPAPPDDGIDEADASNLLFDEPIPRKRKVGALCTVLCTQGPGMQSHPMPGLSGL